MERIQSALEKARASRANTASIANAADTAPRPQQDGAVDTLEREPPVAEIAEITDPAVDIEANWQALTPFTPKPRLMQRNRIVAFEGGPDAAHIDMMRTRILQQMRLNGWRRLAVTSPGPGCGKTTTCLNLAFSLSRLSDQRTILTEIDMRRPGMAIGLGTKGKHGFARVLAGEDSPAEQLLRCGDNVAIGLNSAPSENPSELLQGPSVAPALTRMEADYAPTIMLFDMPPMMTADDMLAFAPHVDCVLLLAAAEQSTIDEIDSCEKELAAHTNVLGVVLNKCRYVGKGYGYGYY